MKSLMGYCYFIRYIFSGLLIIAILLLHTYFFTDNGHYSNIPEADEQAREQVLADSRMKSTQLALPSDASDIVVKKRFWAKPILPEPERGLAVPDEWQLKFRNHAEMEVFSREAAALDGVQIMETNGVLHILRIRCGDREKLQNLIENSAVNPTDTSVNYLFTAPLPSNDTVSLPLSYYFPVGTDYLKGIGVENSSLVWGEGVTVALVDSGISGTLLIDQDRITTLDLMEESGESGVLSPHGTIMASLIAGMSELSPGVAPGVSIIDIRVLDSRAIGDGFTIAQGIVSAVKMGADIINLSLGGMGDDMAVRAAVEYAMRNRVAVVAAAGNTGDERMVYPARYPGVISVGAIDAAGQHADFSNIDTGITLSAPGYGIVTELSPGVYVRSNGTSAAAALVSGAIASVMSHEALSSTEAAALIIAFADDRGKPGHDPEFGMGSVNLSRISRRFTDYVDLAVAGYFWETLMNPQTEGEGKTLFVTVSNQGTVTAWDITVEVKINDEMESMYIPSLEAGESSAVATRLTGEALEDQGVASVTLNVWSDQRDENPLNNMKSYYLYR